MLLAQRQQFFDLVQREPQFLSMPGKCEIANLLSVEQAISARAATHTLDESEFLIEADCVHADFGQLCGLTDVNDLRHVWKDKPWSSVQSHEEIVGLESVMDELERTVTAESTNAADAGPKVSAQSSFVFVCFSPCRQSYPIIIVVHRHVEFSEIARTFVYRPWGTMIASALADRLGTSHRNRKVAAMAPASCATMKRGTSEG